MWGGKLTAVESHYLGTCLVVQKAMINSFLSHTSIEQVAEIAYVLQNGREPNFHSYDFRFGDQAHVLEPSGWGEGQTAPSLL